MRNVTNRTRAGIADQPGLRALSGVSITL
jgi:hypothetical protein